MKYLFIEYPKCSTCQKAKKWLETNKIEYEDRHIVEQCPNKKELTKWIKQSGKEIKSFFNTSGNQYKELKLKEKLPEMPYQEEIELLASSGMLIKRPLLISEDNILIGFKQKEWEDILKK